MMTLAAADFLTHATADFKNRISTILTFGSPRVGNPAFATWFKSILDAHVANYKTFAPDATGDTLNFGRVAHS